MCKHVLIDIDIYSSGLPHAMCLAAAGGCVATRRDVRRHASAAAVADPKRRIQADPPWPRWHPAHYADPIRKDVSYSASSIDMINSLHSIKMLIFKACLRVLMEVRQFWHVQILIDSVHTHTHLSRSIYI